MGGAAKSPGAMVRSCGSCGGWFDFGGGVSAGLLVGLNMFTSCNSIVW